VTGDATADDPINCRLVIKINSGADQSFCTLMSNLAICNFTCTVLVSDRRRDLIRHVLKNDNSLGQSPQ
jgi:hypothetical protein